VHCTTLVLGLLLGVQLYTLAAPGRRQIPSGFGVWEGPEDRILRVMGYVFFRSQWEGHGAAVYDFVDLEAAAKRVI